MTEETRYEFLSPEQAGRKMEVTYGTIIRWCHAGVFNPPAVKIGKGWRIPRSAVENALNGGLEIPKKKK